MLIVHKRATNLKQILVKRTSTQYKLHWVPTPARNHVQLALICKKQPVSPHGKQSKSSQLKDAFGAKLKMSFT